MGEQGNVPKTAAAAPLTDYDHLLDREAAFIERQRHGKVVIWPHDREMQSTRQGRLRYYLNTNHLDTCLDRWAIKVQEIPERSGRHRHQGGVIIFVLEGEGRTVVEDASLPWRAGDLVVLPIRPGGVAHQHFNETPDGRAARWAAYSHDAVKENLSSELVQLETAPTWRPDATS